MDNEEYKEFVISKISLESLGDLELVAALGMAGEAGEIIEVIKKERFHSHPRDRHHLVNELGDLFFYFTLMLEAQGYTLDGIIEENILKLNKRYPRGFEKERSIHR